MFSRMSSLPYLKAEDKKKVEEEIDHCVEKLLETTSVVSPYVLCHGLPGNLDILSWYLGQRENEQIRAFIGKNREEMIDYILTKGIITEYAPGLMSVSLMTGIAGVAYYLLQYLDPSIPSILTLDTL